MTENFVVTYRVNSDGCVYKMVYVGQTQETVLKVLREINDNDIDVLRVEPFTVCICVDCKLPD